MCPPGVWHDRHSVPLEEGPTHGSAPTVATIFEAISFSGIETMDDYITSGIRHQRVAQPTPPILITNHTFNTLIFINLYFNCI